MKRLIFAAMIVLAAGAVRAEEITVFAASSLKTALDEIAATFSAGSGVPVVLAYDGSAKLAQQILNGAPADLFISAAPNWMDAAAGAMVAGSRVDLLGNDLALIAAGQMGAQEITQALDIGVLLGGGRLAMGQVNAVPVGQYGQAALQNLGLWAQVKDHLAEVETARAALDLVARGEVPLGVVYGSDFVAARAAGLDVSLIGIFPDTSHPPIRYPAALVTGAGPEAAQFLAYLQGPQAREVFETQGFTVLPP